nr:transcription factor 25 [Hymenolepis microstoma]
MSYRALRKMLSSKIEAEENDNEANEEINLRPKQSIFSMFDVSTLPGPTVPSSDDESVQEARSTPSQSTKRKKNRRRKNKNKSLLKPEPTDDDALFEAEQKSHAQPVTSKKSDSAMTTSELLSVNRKFLDYRAELNRKFGSSANENKTRNPLPFGQLVRPNIKWPRFERCGLEMKQSDDGSFAFTHDKEYTRQQKAFYVLQDALDPQLLSMFLSKAPYHVDTLLSLSEYLMHQDQSEVASDLLERVLYAYQITFHLGFSFSSARSCRLDYRLQENRSIFIAIFRYIFYVSSRSCYRSALEYSKALLLLNPDTDPLAILLAIDFFAISAEDYEFLIELYESWNPNRNLYLFPNFAFSIPLARWSQRNRQRKRKRTADIKDSEEIDKMLQDALIMFPGFLPRLMKHTKVGGTSNLDKSELFGKEIRLTESEYLGRLLDLYMSQAHYHWQEPDVLLWLETNVEKVLQLVEPTIVDPANPSVKIHNPSPDKRLKAYSDKRKRLYNEAPRNVLRHLFLRELQDAPPIVPPEFANKQIYPLDPFPPVDAINTYDPEAERRNSRSTEGGLVGFLNNFFATLWPSIPSEQQDVDHLNDILGQFGLAVAVDELASTESESDEEEEHYSDVSYSNPYEFD